MLLVKSSCAKEEEIHKFDTKGWQLFIYVYQSWDSLQEKPHISQLYLPIRFVCYDTYLDWNSHQNVREIDFSGVGTRAQIKLSEKAKASGNKKLTKKMLKIFFSLHIHAKFSFTNNLPKMQSVSKNKLSKIDLEQTIPNSTVKNFFLNHCKTRKLPQL